MHKFYSNINLFFCKGILHLDKRCILRYYGGHCVLSLNFGGTKMDRKKALASVLAGLCSISSSALAGGPGEKNILKRPRSQSVGGRSKMLGLSSGHDNVRTGDRKNRFNRSRSPVSRGLNSGSTRDRSKGSTSSKDLKGKAVIFKQNISTSKSDNSLLKLLLTGIGGTIGGGALFGIPTYFITKKKNGSPAPAPGAPNVNQALSIASGNFAHALGFVGDNTFLGGNFILPDSFINYVSLLDALTSLRFEANKNQMCITCKVKPGFPEKTLVNNMQVETHAAQIAKLEFKFAISEGNMLSIDSVVAPEQFNFPSLVWLCSGSNCKTVGSTLVLGVSTNGDFLGKAKCLLAKALFRSFMVSAVNNVGTVDNMCKFNDGVCIDLLAKTIN